MGKIIEVILLSAVSMLLLILCIYLVDKYSSRKDYCIGDCQTAWTGGTNWNCVEACMRIR